MRDEAALAEPVVVTTWTVFFPGHWPGYTQIHERPGNHYASRTLKLRWQNSVALKLVALRLPMLPCVRLHYLHRRKDRRTDKSNLASAAMKIIEDAMVQVHIVQDDGWNFVEGFTHAFEVSPQEGVQLTIEARGHLSP